MDAQANLTVGSGEKRLSFRSSENASQTVVTLWLVRYNHSILATWPIRRPVRSQPTTPQPIALVQARYYVQTTND